MNGIYINKNGVKLLYRVTNFVDFCGLLNKMNIQY